MFKDWPEHTALVKKAFGELGKNHPKMLQLRRTGSSSRCRSTGCQNTRTDRHRRCHYHTLRKLYQRACCRCS